MGVTLVTRLTWSPLIDQVRKKIAQKFGMLGPLLNRKGDLSIRIGVMLYMDGPKSNENYFFAQRSRARKG
jgi:hypothetical protein